MKKTVDSTENQSGTIATQGPRSAIEEKTETKQPDIKETAADTKVAPGNAEVSGCQVIATVISIDEALDTENPSSPCGQVPCGALIRINKIVKMGQLCAPFVVPGLELRAYFKITLHKTDQLFPDMKQHFPGLDKSDTFAASFVTMASQSGDQYQVVINGYTRVE
ncbi:MAG: hypothetical protein JKY18_10175 [Flavobacteriales bacterium]|nr:hypothetical protein [Flavobacteriales bacterium]